MKQTLILVLSLLGTSALAQGRQRVNEPKVDWNMAQFAHPSAETTLEHFFAFDAASLPWRADSTRISAALPIRLVFTTADQEPAAAPAPTETVLRFEAEDPSAMAPGRLYLHYMSTPLAPGQYVASLTVGSEASGIRRIDRELDVKPLGSGEPAFSDILLAGGIGEDATSPGAYQRNGLSIQPNPGSLFGTGLSVLFYYVEAYDLGSLSTPGAAFYSFISQTHATGPIYGFENRSPIAEGAVAAAYGSFDLSELPNGTYRLISRVLDAADNTLLETETRFFVYNPGVKRARSSVTASASTALSTFGAMPKEEIDKHFEQIKIAATEDDRRRMRRIKDTEDRRRFIVSFWENRDPDPSRPGNNALDDFNLRLEYANDRYGARNREGWETDRGRVVIRYGIPDDVQDEAMENDVVAHSIWSYTNITGIGPGIFVFADTMGFNNYELIHSNVPGERQSLDWQAELRRYK